MLLEKTGRSLKYALGLSALAYFTSGIGTPKKEYHFSPLVSREDVVLPVSEVMNLYLDCDQKFYNSNRFRYTRTTDEIKETVQRRKQLEEKLTRYYNEQVALSRFTTNPIDTTPGWHDPLNGIGWFHNSFDDPRPRKGGRIERHGAIDIFAPVGSYIHAPINGIVIASADDWRGSWSRKKGLKYEGGGLGELAGNGIILFDPINLFYYLMIHMKDVYVQAGEVVSRGNFLGTVGRTGNAISPYTKTHLHLAGKKPRSGCGVEDVLGAENSFWILAENRGMLNRPVYVEEALY